MRILFAKTEVFLLPSPCTHKDQHTRELCRASMGGSQGTQTVKYNVGKKARSRMLFFHVQTLLLLAVLMTPCF